MDVFVVTLGASLSLDVGLDGVERVAEGGAAGAKAPGGVRSAGRGGGLGAFAASLVGDGLAAAGLAASGLAASGGGVASGGADIAFFDEPLGGTAVSLAKWGRGTGSGACGRPCSGCFR